MTGDIRHGTRWSYERHGCRCDLCRAEKAEHERVRRARIDSPGHCPLCATDVDRLIAHEQAAHPKRASQ